MKQADPSFDLPRLTESDPALAEQLSLLKAQLPDASELARLASRLQLQGVDVASPPAAQVATPAPWPKWLLGGGGAVMMLLGLWTLGPSKPVAPADGAVDLSPAIASASSGPAPITSAETRPPASRAEPGTARAATTERAVPPATASATAVAAQSPSDSAAPLPAPSVPVAAPTPPRDTAARTMSGSPPLSAQGGSMSSGGSPQDPDASTEIELLRDARLALKRSPASALELTEQHTRAYPSGKLVQERELIAVSALIALGRRTAALSRASRFERAFPQSPYRKQLAELLR